jgi:hypothetical protein
MNTDRYKRVSCLQGNVSKRERISFRRRDFSCSGGGRINSGVMLRPATSGSASGKLGETIHHVLRAADGSHRVPRMSPNKLAQVVTSWFRFGRYRFRNRVSRWGFSWFTTVPPVKCRDVSLDEPAIGSIHILRNSLFTGCWRGQKCMCNKPPNALFW